jgi:putative membrane protein insertion efficiency factor
MMRWLWLGPRFFLATFLIAGVRLYQVALRPLLPAVCPFEPSCSEYFIAAVQKHGPLLGAARGAWRLCRCHPFTRGGYDPP